MKKRNKIASLWEKSINAFGRMANDHESHSIFEKK